MVDYMKTYIIRGFNIWLLSNKSRSCFSIPNVFDFEFYQSSLHFFRELLIIVKFQPGLEEINNNALIDLMKIVDTHKDAFLKEGGERKNIHILRVQPIYNNLQNRNIHLLVAMNPELICPILYNSVPREYFRDWVFNDIKSTIYYGKILATIHVSFYDSSNSNLIKRKIMWAEIDTYRYLNDLKEKMYALDCFSQIEYGIESFLNDGGIPFNSLDMSIRECCQTSLRFPLQIQCRAWTIQYLV
jgi:hypothetical protein